MSSWFEYLKQGLARALPRDRITGRSGYADTRTNLRNLRPFWDRHWRKGALGIFAVLITSLLLLPQPLVTRYLLDQPITGSSLARLCCRDTIRLSLPAALPPSIGAARLRTRRRPLRDRR